MQKLSEKDSFVHDEAVLGFVYHLECIGVDGKIKWTERIENIIPDVGRDYILNAALNSQSQYATFYIGLYTASRTPLVGDDMTSLMLDCSESVTYDGTVRLTLTPDALANGLWSNTGTPAEFDFNTSGETLRGGFITSSSARGTASGLLLSAVLFPTPKTLTVGETLRVTAGLQLVTA